MTHGAWPMRLLFLVALLSSFFVTFPVPVHGDASRPVELPDRVNGADRVVLGRVVSVTPSYRTNQWGDRLIVSRLVVQVEEAMKGASEATVALDVEGGTIGDLSLHVSDLPEMTTGERAVFFLKSTADGVHVPHLRGQGILKLDDSDRVRNSSLTVPMIREIVRQATPRQP